MDIKQGDKFVPLAQLHGRAGEIAEAMRHVLRDMETYTTDDTTTWEGK